MNNIEITEKLYKSIENNDFGTVDSLLSDDFTFEGPFPEPMNKQAFIEAHQGFTAAFDNFRYNISDLKDYENSTEGTVQISGTHTGTLDLSDVGGPVVDPTNKSFQLSKDAFRLSVKDGKIARLFSQPGENGGMEGILKALGVPAMEPTS